MTEYDKLWEFLHQCDFEWECVDDHETGEHNLRVVRIIFEVEDNDD